MPGQPTAERIHRFRVGDRLFALDVDNCFVFETDEIGYHALEHYGRKRPNEIIHLLGEQFDPVEAREVLEELESLRQDGHILREAEEDSKKGAEEKKWKDKVPTGHTLTLLCSAPVSDKSGVATLEPPVTPELARKGVDFLVMRSGAEENLTVEFLFAGLPNDRKLIDAAAAQADQAGTRFKKEFNYRLIAKDLPLSSNSARAVGNNGIDFSFDFKSRETLDPLLKFFDSRAARKGIDLSKLASAASPGRKAAPSGRVHVRPRTIEMVQAVKHLHQLGFTDIAVEFDEAYAPDGILAAGHSQEELVDAWRLVATYYLECILRQSFFRLYPISDLFRKIFYGEKTLRKCPAMRNEIFLTGTGELYPCRRFFDRRDMRLGSLDGGDYSLDTEQRFEQLHVEDKPECSVCWARHFCGGSCPAASSTKGFAPVKPSLKYCDVYRTLVEICTVCYNTLQEAAIPLSRTWGEQDPTSSVQFALGKLKGEVRMADESDLEQIVAWEEQGSASYFLLDGIGKRSVMERAKELEDRPATGEFIILIDGKREGLFKTQPHPQWHHAEISIFFSNADLLVSEPIAKLGRGIMNHLFESQGLNRLFARVMEEDVPLVKYFEAIGFQNEGTLRRFVFHSSDYHDIRVMGILAPK